MSKTLRGSLAAESGFAACDCKCGYVFVVAVVVTVVITAVVATRGCRGACSCACAWAGARGVKDAVSPIAQRASNGC